MFQPQFRESELFLAKYRHCLSRALSLIRTHVFNILNGATQQVLPTKVGGHSDTLTCWHIDMGPVLSLVHVDSLSVTCNSSTSIARTGEKI